MDHDIRQMLRDRADDVAPSLPTLPASTLKRARRSRASTVVSGVLVVALLVGAGTVFARLGSGDRSIEPVGPRVNGKLSISLPEKPRDIAYGAGAAWVATDHSLFRLDPSDGRIVQRWAYPLSGYPRPAYLQSTISVTPNAVWIGLAADGVRRREPVPQQTQSCDDKGRCHAEASLSAGEGSQPKNFKNWWALFHVDIATGKASLGSKSYAYHIGPISAGPTGVWVGVTDPSFEQTGWFYRFDGATGRLIDKVDVAGWPLAISANTTNVLAVVQTPGDHPNLLVRVDPAHKRIAASVPIQDALSVFEINGSAWVVEHSDLAQASTVSRWSLPGLERTGSVRVPFDVTDFGWGTVNATADGIWVVGGFPGKLSLIDPYRMRLVGTVDSDTVGEHSVATMDAIWTEEPAPGQPNVFRFTAADIRAALHRR